MTQIAELLAAAEGDHPSSAIVLTWLRRHLRGVAAEARRAAASAALTDLADAVLEARNRVAAVAPPGTGLYRTERRVLYVSRGPKPYLAPRGPERVSRDEIYLSRDIASEEISVQTMVDLLREMGESTRGMLTEDQLDAYVQWQTERGLRTLDWLIDAYGT